MTDPEPIACSLGASDLQQRLNEIAELGAASLIGHDAAAGKHTLRFRPDPTTRRRLEEIVAAEAECCSFLELALSKDGDSLVLSIAAPRDAQMLADELASAFTRGV